MSLLHYAWPAAVDSNNVMVGTAKCLPAPCYSGVEDCALLCATSGLLARANERSCGGGEGGEQGWDEEHL